MNGTCNSTIFWVPPPGALGRGQRSSIIKSKLLSQFQIFLNQTLCLSLQMQDIKHNTGFSLGPLGHAQGFGTWRCWASKFYFLNMVMWHIKLKGMNSSPGYIERFYPTNKLVNLGWGQRVNYH